MPTAKYLCSISLLKFWCCTLLANRPYWRDKAKMLQKIVGWGASAILGVSPMSNWRLT